MLIGLAGGRACATWPVSWLARGLHLLAALVLSVPRYWLGFIVLIWFAPGTGYVLEVPFVSALMGYEDLTESPLGWLKALWMPWILAGLPLAARVLRMTTVTHSRLALAPVAAWTGATFVADLVQAWLDPRVR